MNRGFELNIKMMRQARRDLPTFNSRLTGTVEWLSVQLNCCKLQFRFPKNLKKAYRRSHIYFALAGAALLLAACGGSKGGSPSMTAPTTSLRAAPTSIASGGSSTLTWSSTNATSCAASGAWSGAKATSGTQSTGAITMPSSYSLTCTGTGGTSVASTVMVNIIPIATLVASPSVIASGGTSTLTWSSTNATSCTASGAGAGWSGAKATSGTQSTGALTATTSYSLSCSGAGGTSSVVTATVMIANGAVAVLPKTAALAQSQTPTIHGDRAWGRRSELGG